jgi:peptidoglycan hydrolase CwlO-like protein
LLKNQVDDLAAKNSSLKAKYDDLTAEVIQLKADLTKAQELVDQRRVEVESKEKKLLQCLQATLDSLRGKPCSLFSIRFMGITSIC